jgi:hypothetical protein
MNEKYKHEIAVRYEREGDIYYDIYYSISDDLYDFMVWAKMHWHRQNDHLFPEAVNAKFYGEV